MDTAGLAHLIGLTALVETGDVEATGSVAAVGPSDLTVTCDGPPWDDTHDLVVLVSVFAPDALYRMSGRAVGHGADLNLGAECEMERIQRRHWPRRCLDLAVTVCPVVEGRHLEGVPGRTVDVGIGGICVETLRELPGGGDPVVILSLPDGTAVVSAASTVQVEDLGDGWRYRLAFQDLESHDAVRISELVD